MEKRIRTFLEYKRISSSEFADSLGVQRSNITHILNSRNKPSFQFIVKMLEVYPELNAKWLLLGIGNMTEMEVKNPTLFDQLTDLPAAPLHQAKKPEIASKSAEPATETEKEIIPQSTEKNTNSNITQDQFFSQEKPIERLIVFFADQTFKVYTPSR